MREQRNAWESDIGIKYRWFVENIQPCCVTAPARQAALDVIRSELATLSAADVEALQRTFEELKEQAAEFHDLRPLVDAQRELLGTSGTAKLSADFDAAATEHGKAWRKWFKALLAWVLFSGVGGVIFLFATKPPDTATNAQIASHIFLDLLIIGLALFVVRILSLQFRAHRHMEVVAHNKASALSTFNRIVVGQEPEVKTVVAAALAQSVFNVDEGIFSDSSSEHVTILERVLSPSLDRIRGS